MNATASDGGRSTTDQDSATFQAPPKHARINDFAIRCFRDMGDGDYIAARMAMRAGLPSQFTWAAEQAIEKYLKCVLVLNRISARNLNHRIADALDRVNTELPFRFELFERERELFQRLVELEGDRYLIHSVHIFAKDLLVLDGLVWRLRQYCQPLNLRNYFDTPSESVLLERVAAIETNVALVNSRDLQAIKFGHISAGKLEGILTKKNGAYGPLVWRNLYYTNATRRSIAYAVDFMAINSPLFSAPDLAEEVSQWMQIHGDVVAGAKELAKRRARGEPD